MRPRWPSGKVSTSGPEGRRSKPDSTEDPPFESTLCSSGEETQSLLQKTTGSESASPGTPLMSRVQNSVFRMQNTTLPTSGHDGVSLNQLLCSATPVQLRHCHFPNMLALVNSFAPVHTWNPKIVAVSM
ncbi:hypothetical protein AVEN_240574-1 [Araneus ventricosus]|uniref:Uncharacterized protein n=1 Tax=Araneus ventricosus TaxID=182803 RepID=A0A4Y2GQG2_ARAVE|nr:hypothetical protein AVEN_240574-1 [Araneus ventricosus]